MCNRILLSAIYLFFTAHLQLQILLPRAVRYRNLQGVGRNGCLGRSCRRLNRFLTFWVASFSFFRHVLYCTCRKGNTDQDRFGQYSTSERKRKYSGRIEMGDQVNSSLLSVHFSNEYEIRYWSHSPENPMIRAADVARWKINKLRIFLIPAPAGGSPSTWGLATRCSNTCHTVSFFFC